VHAAYFANDYYQPGAKLRRREKPVVRPPPERGGVVTWVKKKTKIKNKKSALDFKLLSHVMGNSTNNHIYIFLICNMSEQLLLPPASGTKKPSNATISRPRGTLHYCRAGLSSSRVSHVIRE
jgi:hypothetical protein